MDTFADTIDMGAGHGLVVGNALVYDNGGGQNIGGLVSGNIYFVSSVAGNNIKLATTSGGPAIDLTSAGTGGNHSLVAPGTSNNVSAAVVNTAADTINLGSAHGVRVGDAVVYDNGGGQNIGGLVSGTTYYVASVDGGNIQLASAPGGSAINLTSAGRGSHHSFTSAANAGQSVNVSAVNDFKAFSFSGGIAIGFVGIGGGVDVGVVRNDTAAYIGDNAQVGARSSVDVNALANRDINTIAIAAAGGGVAAAGSVTVWTIGDAVKSTYDVAQSDDSGNSKADESADAFAASGVVFKASSDVSGNEITFGNDHSFQTGDAVVYHHGDGGSDIGGLVDGQTYYAIRDSADNTPMAVSSNASTHKLRLADTKEHDVDVSLGAIVVAQDLLCLLERFRLTPGRHRQRKALPIRPLLHTSVHRERACMGNAGNVVQTRRLEHMQKTLHLDPVVLAGWQRASPRYEQVADGARLVLPDRIHDEVGAVEVDRLDEDPLAQLVF